MRAKRPRVLRCGNLFREVSCAPSRIVSHKTEAIKLKVSQFVAPVVLGGASAFRGIRSYSDQNCDFQAGPHRSSSPAPAHGQPKGGDHQCRNCNDEQSSIHFFLDFRFLKRRASARQLSYCVTASFTRHRRIGVTSATVYTWPLLPLIPRR